MTFDDRVHAGRELARRLAHLENESPMVIALPRGGIPVAAQIARAMGAPLDLLAVKKIGAPYHPELAIGAIAEGGTMLLEESVSRASEDDVWQAVAAARRELDRRIRFVRGERAMVDVRRRTVILVDDGIATGWTMRAAIREMRRRGAASVVVAAPVIAASTLRELASDADDVVCLTAPHRLVAVSAWYRHFEQLTDDAVRRWLGALPVLTDDAAPP